MKSALRVHSQVQEKQESRGGVYCPMCTHTVEADIITVKRHSFAKPGQKCPRCAASLDAGYVMRFDRAA